MKQLTLIGGPMGVGKTAVCNKLMERLAPAAFLDGDWCWHMSPFVVNDETRAMVKDNIVSVLNRYLQSPELEHVIFGWVMHQADIVDELTSRLNSYGVKVNVVTLMCDKNTLRARLEKDVQAGLRQVDVIDRALDRLACCEKLPYTKVWTDGLNIEEVTDLIIEMILMQQDRT